jgi:hypothetical protein
MKPPSRFWILLALLGAGAVNSLFLIPHAARAAKTFYSFRGLTNAERRYLQRGNWYRAVFSIDEQIPLNASVRLVSPAPPWFLAYYLYPRLLKKGSESLSDRELVRKQYPGDWVLVYSESSAAEMTAYPPLKPAAR